MAGVVFYQRLEVTDEYGMLHCFDVKDKTQGALVRVWFSFSVQQYMHTLIAGHLFLAEPAVAASTFEHAKQYSICCICRGLAVTSKSIRAIHWQTSCMVVYFVNSLLFLCSTWLLMVTAPGCQGLLNS